VADKKKKTKRVGLHDMPIVEKLLGRIEEIYSWAQLNPESTSIEVPNASLGGWDGNQVSMGNFYEAVTRAIWGGILVGTQFAECKNNGSTPTLFEDLEDMVNWEGLSEETLVKPDLLIPERSWGESKSWRIDQSCHLLDGQVGRYEQIQKRYPNYEVFFAFYGHRYFGIRDAEVSGLELFGDLCNGTKYAVRAPFSLIRAMHAGTGESNGELSYRYSGAKYQPCTMARIRIIRGLLECPEEIIEKLGLDPEDYAFQKVTSPYGIKVNTAGLRPASELILDQFPVLVIRDKDHSKWVEKFLNGTDLPVEEDDLDLPF